MGVVGTLNEHTGEKAKDPSVMEGLLRRLANVLRIDLDALAGMDQARMLIELSGILFGLPWMGLGLGWLIARTDLALAVDHWATLVLILILAIILTQFAFFQVARSSSGSYNYTSSTLTGVVSVSAIFLYGPTGVWVHLLPMLVYYGLILSQRVNALQRLNWARNLIFNLGAGAVVSLSSLWVYQRLGGGIPFQALSGQGLVAAIAAMLIYLPAEGVVFWLWTLVIRWFRIRPSWDLEGTREQYLQTIKFILFADIPSVFGVLAAAMFSQMGLTAYLFFVLGLVLVSMLARWLSRAVMSSAQRSEELDQLERLGRAIIAAPPESSLLPALLKEYIPGMFSYQQIEARLFEGPTLIQLPEDRHALPPALWSWLDAHPGVYTFSPMEILPWTRQVGGNYYFLLPILSTEGAVPLGGICLIQEGWFLEATSDLVPALQVLAAQIASALHSAEVYEQTLVHQRVAQELAFAGQIQATFLPSDIPDLAGWQLAATLLPAKETSGDFYDFIPLSQGRLGILVADVADKGVAAALFMALSRTLIRTYALQNSDSPAEAFTAANARILLDSQGGLFITAFYGILDPLNGRFVYTNAGHNPPFLISNHGDENMKELARTGVPLGLFEDQAWEERVVIIPPEADLILYTDGLTEAQDSSGAVFGSERLREIFRSGSARTAVAVQAAILDSIAGFVGGTPQFDDITLVVLQREGSPAE
jgi:serine phosphatase RsbU (regulator of sigma subunit)